MGQAVEQSELKSRYRVDKFAWLIAGLSLAAALIVIYFVLSSAGSIYRNLYSRRVADDLREQRYAEAQKNLTPLFEGPPIIGKLNSRPNSMAEMSKEAASALIDTLSSLSPASLTAAEGRVDSVKRRLAVAPENSGDFSAPISDLEQEIHAAAQQKASVDSLTAQRSRLESTMSGFRTQYDLLAKDAAELFGLPAKALSAQSVPSFYSSGVLANLPVLSGLPDGIPSLDDLRDKLASAGGGVRLSGEDVHQLFQDKLDSLRQSGSSLSTGLAGTNSELASTVSALTNSSRKLDEKMREISEKFRAAIANLLPSARR